MKRGRRNEKIWRIRRTNRKEGRAKRERGTKEERDELFSDRFKVLLCDCVRGHLGQTLRPLVYERRTYDHNYLFTCDEYAGVCSHSLGELTLCVYVCEFQLVPDFFADCLLFSEQNKILMLAPKERV